MKRFTKYNLIKDGIYLLYVPRGKGDTQRNFVARFKYNGPFTMAVFKRELMKNHTVESYFTEYLKGKAPLEILKEKNPTWYESTMEKWREKQNPIW